MVGVFEWQDTCQILATFTEAAVFGKITLLRHAQPHIKPEVVQLRLRNVLRGFWMALNGACTPRLQSQQLPITHVAACLGRCGLWPLY